MNSNGLRLHSRLIPILFTIALGACSTQSPQSQAAANAKIGCNFDSNKVCQRALTQPVSTSGPGGLTTSNQTYLAQNSPITSWVMVPIKAPDGSEVDVQCEISYQQMKVIYAYAVPSGTVSDKDRDWLRQVGYCTGEVGTEGAPALHPEQ